MKRRIIAVEREDGSLRQYDRKLRKLGLSYSGGGKYAGTWVSGRQENRVRNFAKQKGARFFFDDEYGSRSANYREAFFKAYPCSARGKYRCVYCGRLFSRASITVDHLYPVAVVSGSMKMRRKLKRQGIKGLNDPKNLVPACWACNMKKSTKMGTWIIRGKIGRNEFLWRMRKLVRYTFIICAVYTAAAYYTGRLPMPALPAGTVETVKQCAVRAGNFVRNVFYNFLLNT